MPWGCATRPLWTPVHLSNLISGVWLTFLWISLSSPGADSALMDLPINMSDLEKVVEATKRGRSPGLDGISYEFYKAIFKWVGPAMADSLNTI